jgi:hypothetical protein
MLKLIFDFWGLFLIAVTFVSVLLYVRSLPSEPDFNDSHKNAFNKRSLPGSNAPSK